MCIKRNSKDCMTEERIFDNETKRRKLPPDLRRATAQLHHVRGEGQAPAHEWTPKQACRRSYAPSACDGSESKHSTAL